MTGAVIGMYFIIVNLFNEVSPALFPLHILRKFSLTILKIILRQKREMVSRKVVIFCYIPYKFVLRIMNIFSV